MFFTTAIHGSIDMQHRPERLVDVDPALRKARAAKVMATLRYVTKKEAVRFEVNHYESDDSEEIPDPFSDDDDNNNELATRRKRFSAHEVNLYLMSSFSAEHKRVEELNRAAMMNDRDDPDNPCVEDLSKVSVSTREHVENEELAAEVNRLLGLTGLDVYQRQKEAEKKALAAKVRHFV